MWGLFVLVLIWEACSLAFFVSTFYLSFSRCFCLVSWLDSRLYPWPKTGQILHSRSCLCVLFWLPTAGRCEPKGWGEVVFPRQGTGGWTRPSVEQSEAEVRWVGMGRGLEDAVPPSSLQPPAHDAVLFTSQHNHCPQILASVPITARTNAGTTRVRKLSSSSLGPSASTDAWHGAGTP